MRERIIAALENVKKTRLNLKKISSFAEQKTLELAAAHQKKYQTKMEFYVNTSTN